MVLDPITGAEQFATAGVTTITTLLNKFLPDKTEIEKAQIVAAIDELQTQTDINKIEAASTNWFVAGWRPFIGWICGAGLLYAALCEPFFRFIAKVGFHYSGEFPIIDTTITMQILVGLLGLGGMRSFEKKTGVAR